MAPPVWILMLLVGAAWGQDQVTASVWRQNSLDPKAMVHTSRESSIVSKCDFEDNSRPFCDWSQMSADDGDWVRTTGPSSTGTSGPPGGYPNGEGYYLHMDANNFPRGGVARLRSPDIWEQGPLCIRFAYHMFGLSWGAQLRLLLLRGRKHPRPNVLWKHLNTQSPSWMPTAVTVPADRDIPSWLMFEGMRGNTAYLDISLDGLSIRRGTCNRICMSQMCTFDTLNDLCGWSWVPTATGAKWTQKKGSSGEFGVGPDDDFSSPGSGYYMLLDSANARPGQKAVLLSPLSHSSGCLTLSFSYIMRGRSPGEGLFVYATFLGNIRKHTLFSGHPGPNWQSVSVNYTGQGQIQFMVVGMFGEIPEPAIAVDAISIAPCGESFPQCSFEDRTHPFCDWNHVLGDPGHWSWGSKSVPTPISGPPREFPFGGDHYIYFDSVKLSQAGQSAKLVSPPFCAPGDVCVEFAYHMYGLGEGTTLKLLLGSPAGSSPVSLWSRVGSQSTSWVNSSVTIPKGHQQPMQLFLEATRGTSTAFVVAVNFIFITHGPCRVSQQTEILPTGPSENIVFIVPTEATPISVEISSTHTEETTTPTEVATVTVEVTSVLQESIPTEVTSVSPEGTSVLQGSIPTEVTAVPTEVTSVSPEGTSVLQGSIPTEVTAVPTEVTSVSPEGTSILQESIPTEVTSVSPEGTSVLQESIPTEVTSVSPEGTSVLQESIPTEVTSVSPEGTSVLQESIPTEVTSVSPEGTSVLQESIPTEVTAVPTEVTAIPTIPTEVTTVSPEGSIISTEVTTATTEVTTATTGVTTATTGVTTLSPEGTIIPTEVTTVSTEETTTSTEVTTVSPEETTIPTEVTTVSPEETTIPTEVTTVSPEETTIPTEVTTVSPEETTTSTEVTTVSPEESTTPPVGITISSEETTVLTEQSTVLMQMPTTCRPPCPSPSQVPGVLTTSMATATESCPANAHFELCACPASCESPKPNCQSPCSPGCVCNPGFLFSNNQCINESACNCFYNNKYYQPGEEWFSPNCTERCRCMPGSRMECQISQCGTHTVCQLQNGQYECQPYGSATCLVYGDLHFVTFDEKNIDFTGTCTYILTQICENTTEPSFKITASTEERGVEGVSSLDKVFITLPETTITMIRDRYTLIAGQRVTLPVIPSNGIFVGLSGRFVELRTTFGLRVRWDGDKQLFVTVPSTYSGKLCGFCGNYDGDSSNDYRKPDGTMTQDEDELGKSWQVEEEEDKKCQNKKSPPSCDPALGRTMSGSNLCGQLVDPKGTFESCLLYMKASSFLDNCVTDMCSFQGLQQMLCAHMSAMTATCQEAGYAVKSWRGPEFCPLDCPQNSRYSLCAKPCPETCHPGSALQPCPEQCVEACECDPGFVLSGFECVPRSQCGCTNVEGRYFKIQEQWFNPDCKEICICEGNNSIRCWPWKCKAQEACSHKEGILGCHAQGEAICIASGDPHYLTFDGALHHFMGTCTYVLTRPCWSNSLDNFVVSATNEIREGNLEVSSIKAVHVQVFDLKISLFKGRRVMLNNQRVALPVWPLKGRVAIRLSGIFVLLYTNFGLQVRYDGKHLVEVTVPSSYTGSLCGMCGNYNNNSLDDNLRPDGKPAGNSLLLGTAWKILEASDPGCFVAGGKSSSCEENNMDESWSKKCSILMNPLGPFSNCHEAVPPQASFSSCVYGQCGTKGDILALCRSLQAYASLCAQAGQVITWRNSTFCPLRCPPMSSYNPCANPCPATCLTLSTARDCPDLPCVEGCECQKGHILSGTTCVPLRQCGCSDQDGSYHLLGESWYTEKTCTTLCTCSVHSNVTCSSTACEANQVCLRQDGLLRCAAEMAECHISEDSQIVSFDGHSHPIQDTCTYIMVKVCHPNMNLPFFTISAKTSRDTHSKIKTFSVYQLYIDIFNFRVILQRDHLVLINNTPVTLPATTQIPGVSITTEDVYTIVTIKDEVQVKFESNSFLDIKIPASSNEKVCGVCGNFNSEEEDELMTSSDELAYEEAEFMESWKDKDIDPNCQNMEEQSLQVEQQEIMNGKCKVIDFEKALAYCQAALQSSAWAQCAARVPLKPFLLGCMKNFCEFKELFRALCEALQSFEDACQNHGLKPPIWRNSSFCALECPAHSHYTNCLPSCPPSCLDPDSRCEGSGHKVPATCREGCICQPGYVLNNDKCVLKTHCGCKDAQGVFVPEGKNWISSSCTQNCVCIGGAIECQNFQCPLGAQCQDNEDGSSNCVKITLQCPAHSLYTNCLPPCPPSCSDPDGHCKGSSPNLPSACKEGCLCLPGFVLEKDKCVPRIQCGCKDTQGAFIPAGKTWMSTGCTQSCTCMRGAIRCRDFQCPSGTHCKDEDGSSDCVKITFQCPAHSQYTNCLPPCPPSCSDPDAHCEGAVTTAPSTCRKGCICQPGYVLDKDKCVLRIECGCQDTQGVFIPAGKTWTSRGCTQSCTCTGGVIHCQTFQCSPGTYCKDSDDGSSHCAKITLQCPAHSQYTDCLPSCQPSCLDPDAHCEGAVTKAPSTCEEGCVCQHDYVLHDDKCIPRIECGCQDTQGILILAGKTWISRGCSRSCTCMGGVIQCQTFQCPPETYCQDGGKGDTSDCVNITLQCPAHSRYTSCLPSCLPSCWDPEGLCEGTSTTAPSTCKEGCVCRDGFVLHEDKCMLRILCDCKDAQGALIPADKTWINRGCSQTCTCVGGVIHCREFQCPSGTFCSDMEDGNSNCTKITLQCPAHSQFTACLPPCPPSCSNPDGHCEDVSTKAPSSCKEGCVCHPGFVLNEDKCIPRIQCGCKDTQGIFIPAGKTWTSRGCTQSCACTGGAIQCQNFRCPSGTYCHDTNDGNSNCTKITLQCPAHSLLTNCLPSCLPSCWDPEGLCSGTSHNVPSTCKEGCVCQPGYLLYNDKCVLKIQCGCKDAQGVVISADKTWINRGCTQSCTCSGGAIQCKEFQCPPDTYCKDMEDGNSNCTKITLQCPAHSYYTTCLPPCPPSCSDPDAHCEGAITKAPSTCKEGCVCQPGFVLYNDKCILRIECGCKDAQGVLIPADKTWINRGCTQSCTCSGGAIQCKEFQCPPDTYCKDMEDGNSNCTKITLHCPANSYFTACLPSCQPSCSNMNAHCEGPSTKASSTCKEGCVCQSGYVLQDDKCVPKSHCGCQDAQGALIPEGKTWITRGCAQSCDCVGGVIQCRTFQCPSGTYCKDSEDDDSRCTKITLQCPARSRYTSCLPPCPPTCSDPQGLCGGTSPKVPSTCKEGCVCRAGFVLQDDKCMLRTLCSCRDAQGALIPPDKTWTSRGCTQRCTCVAGTIHCRNMQCPSGTFCKNMADGSSNCTKITLQCPAHSQFTACLPPCPPSCSNPDGHCEDVSTKAPSSCKEGCVCDHGFVLNEDKCIPRIQCGCKDTRGDLIPPGKTWTSRGCTQSCACVGGDVQCQTFQCPQGTYCKDSDDDSSHCAKITLQCPDHTHYTACLPSCQPSCSDPEGHCEGTSLKVPSTCKEGCVCQPDYVLHNDKCVLRTQCDCRDARGVLIPAGKTWTSTGCTQSCTCMGGAVQCQNFQCPSETYCKDNNDGTSNCVKITLQCPTHSLFTDCLPPCLPTCLDPDGLCKGTSPKVPSTCKEGCICQSGYVLQNDKCMLRTLCGCKDAQGALIPEGKTLVSKGCTQSCACRAGSIHCLDFQCPPGTYCKNDNDDSSHCAEIPLQCPVNSSFTACLPSCPPSCLDPEGHCGGTGLKVPSACKEGCLCHSGFVLDNDKCVPRIHCGCKGAQGALIPAGKTWTPRGCTQSCTCMGGAVQCRHFQCPSETYCKDNSDGTSDCVKITLQCPAHSLYTDCLPSCQPSCSDPDAHCEGTSPKVPSTCKEGCVCQPGYVLSNDKCVLKTECDCKDTQGPLIPAGKTWITRGCTQSCTCTGGVIHCQNFRCPQGTYCKDNNDGSSHCAKITLQCPDHSHFTDCLPSCPPSCADLDAHCEHTSPKVPSTCKEGCLCQPGYFLNNDKCVLRIHCDCKDVHGSLIPAGKTWISKGCTQDCACTGGDVQCQNFQCPSGTFCKDSSDGNSHCVKITLQCPAHSHFTSCLPSCPPSCSVLDGHCEENSSKVPATCREGCLCQPGYLLNNDKCVLRIQCSCKDAHGGLIPAGKTWITKGCTESCNCMGGTIQCRTFQCSPGTYCKDSSDGSSHCVKITLQCPAHSRYTNCLPPCLPSCTDPDAHCEGTSPQVPSTCKEGCLCQPGYVVNNDKCVLQIHCGCKDAQGALVPAGETWVSSGCTQSCTCVGGAIQCRSFNCPPGTQCQDGRDGHVNCTKIPLQCPAHSRYTSCLPSCIPSCSDPEGLCGGTSPRVPSTCKEGCICRAGFVLHNNKCMLRILCGCKDAQGALIPAEKSWLSKGCTQNCTCVAGKIHCRDIQCPSGTHCKDDDDGSSHCVKVALKCPPHSYYTNCLPSCIPSCSNLNEHCEVPSVTGPSTCKEGCLCQSGFVLNKDKCVLRIQCGCKDSQGAPIPAGKTWIATGCSQKCTCEGGLVQCHEFQCPSGTQCQDIEDGSSDCAEITLQCPAHSRYTDCLPSCQPSCLDPEGFCKGVSPKAFTCKEGCICQSGYVLSGDKCIPKIQCNCKDPHGDLILAGKTWISSGCTQSCTCVNGAIECHTFTCPSDTHCQHSDDGSSNCASNTPPCPAYSHLTDCLPSCLPSCLDPDAHCEGTSPKVPAVCKTGCLCQPGYVLNNDKCIPRIECGCKDSQGTLIPESKTWISSGCTQSCTCRGGAVQCQDFKCPVGTHCQHSVDGSSHCASDALHCPAHSLYTACLPSCLPSCSDPEGLCDGSSTKVPSSCREGCVCRSGYVLHEDKCVLRIHCACKVSHGSLIQTGQTWISTHCTQICACKGGLFQCQKFQCPSGTQCEKYEDGSSNCVSNTLQCPDNSLYTTCLPPCLPSCSNPNGHCEGISTKVAPTCKEGCVCRPGYLLNKDTCVHRDQCGCKDVKGDLIPAGKAWISSGCTQSCACESGDIQCRDFSCPSGTHCQHNEDGSSSCAANKLEKCTIFGDPYYHTFDGLSYRFLGRMNYYLIKTVDKLPEGVEHLVIEGRNKVTSTESPTLHEVTTIVYGYKIQLQEGLLVLVNNQKVSVPYNPNNHLQIILRAQRLFLITDFEMVVDFDGEHNAVISLPTMYHGLVRGLCGNYDKNRDNDFMLPNDMLTSNLNTFGDSWEVKVDTPFRLPRALPEEDEGEENPDLLLSECSPEQTALISSTQACRVLVDPQGPFAACHQIIAPEPFEQHCMSDMCAGWKTKEEEELRCRVLSGYAIICQEAGANMTGWRDQTHCAMTCPANTVYQRCMTPCPASCAKFVTPKVCEGPCVEGCASIPGYIYSDTQSLPVAHCGCTASGIYYKLGDSFVTDDCSQQCTCASQGTLLCEPYGCRAPESCTVANFTRGCFRDSPCLQNPCHNDGRCQEQGATFICHCDPGYGGALCTEPRDIPPRKKLESSTLLAILPGVFAMVLAPFLLPRMYVYMTTRTATARSGEKC
ncbi:zonadhesin isoform X2 [Peromyscus maniculatus bairdii]|uniref:zonadhesin isoform X2 n=1 Tax=Peromyscus maniculatus bairdii TaxID=230844 RepID=UPI003FD5D107